MSDSKIIALPPARDRVSSLSLEIDRIEGEMRALRRADNDIFRHLARKVHGYLGQVEKQGLRTGRIGRIIGGPEHPSAKDRLRFSWDGKEDRDFTASPLNKNGLHWLNVIARCAEELRLSRADLVLDAVNGSRIRPSGGPSEYAEGSWLAEFHSLMEALQTRLTTHRDMEGLFTYLVQSQLDLDEAGNLSHSDEPVLPWFRAEFPEWPTIFGQIPHAMVCGDLVGGFAGALYVNQIDDQRDAWLEFLASAFPEFHPEGANPYLMPWAYYGLAIVPDAQLRPSLALYKWAHVVAGNIDDAGRETSYHLSAAGLDLAGAILGRFFPDFNESLAGRVLFASLGTKAFDEMATTSFDDFLGRVGGNENRCWDPFHDAEPDALEYASNAPDMTVAAMIERNLLFADAASVPDQRIDRILEQDIEKMARSVRKHRERIRKILGPAKRALLNSWSESREPADNGKIGEGDVQ